jgi:F-type H+-transporting ATPase subunit b
LGLFIWPKIGGALDDRANKIREEIEAAEMARSQAKDALEQYQQSLSQARAEAQKEIDKARAQAQVIAADLRANADRELSAMREKALRDIDSAKRSAVAEVYEQSTQLATTMAGKILQRNVTTQDTQRLLDESLAQLQTMKN